MFFIYIENMIGILYIPMLIQISNFEYNSLNSSREVVKITFGGTTRKLLLWTEGISGIERYSNMARSLHQKQKVTQRKRLVRHYFVYNFILNYLIQNLDSNLP